MQNEMKMRVWVALALASSLLLGCTSTTTVPVASAQVDPLAGTQWQLASVDRGEWAELEAIHTVTLGFAEGRAAGHAGCNRYFASYSVQGQRLELGHPGSTMMYCEGEGEGSVVEAAFLPLLEGTLTFEASAQALVLHAADGTSLRFEPQAEDGPDKAD